MRTTLLTLLLLIGSAFSFSQNLHNQDMVLDYLGQDRFDHFQQSNPNYLVYLDVKFSKGYSIINRSDAKLVDEKFLSSIDYKPSDGDKTALSADVFIQMYNQGTLNFLRVILPYDQKKDTYYVLGKTGKVLVLHSANSIVSATNQITQN